MKSGKHGIGVLLFGVIVVSALYLWLYVPEAQTYVTELYTELADYFIDKGDTEFAGEAAGETIPAEEMSESGSNGTLVDSNELYELEDSGISGADYTFDTTGCPYYSFLTDAQKNVYRQACANIEALETAVVPIEEITPSQMEEVMEAVFGDHPEYFWLETSYGYRYTSEDICVQLALYYNSISEDLESTKLQFDTVTREIIGAAENLESDYEKEKYVHDAILQIAEYDESVDNSLSQSAYSALVMGRTVCAGYARAFQYIMTQLGIETFFVAGYASEEHAWNIVALSDGYYNVDLTWDDNVTTAYTYFNIPDSVFSQTHTRTGLSTQLPACIATEYYNPEISQNAGQIPERFRPQESVPDENQQPVTQPEGDSQSEGNLQPDIDSFPESQPESGSSATEQNGMSHSEGLPSGAGNTENQRGGNRENE